MKYAMNNMAVTACLLLSISANAGIDECNSAYDKNDFSVALKECLPLAKQGNPKAQNVIGRMYGGGQGVPQDYQETLKWYRLAADQGNAEAQTNSV